MPRPRSLALLAAAALALALVSLAVFRDVANGPPPAPAGQEAPRKGVPAWTNVPLPPPRWSPVESLRQKTAAGYDRFVVEALDEEIAAPLERLREKLRHAGSGGSRTGGSAEPPGAVFAPEFRSAGFVPARSRRVLELPGVLVERGLEPGARGLEASDFLEEVARMTAPAERLDRAELKVVAIEGGEDGPIAAAVLFFFAGSGAGGGSHQWSGSARLSFRAADRLLARWETLAWEHVELATLPFQDVTARALASCPSYRSILARSLDDFRARLDAATGIDVYGHNGLAVGDADGDGLEDLYVLLPGGLPNVLYRSRPDGTFEDASRASGTDVLDGTSQALFFDIENDGDEDLFLVTERGAAVLSNDGSGRFEERRGAVPLDGFGRSTPLAAAAADFDCDGFVDVYVASYVFWRGGGSAAGTTLPVPYHEARNGAENFLLRNAGDGTFRDVTDQAGLGRDNTRFSFAAGWGDYDADGRPDLYVANDFGSNNLFHNNGDGTFTDVASAMRVEDIGAGMSVAWEDFDADGDLDLYVGNMFSAAGRRVTGRADYKSDEPLLQEIYRRHARGNSLFRNASGAFEDVSIPSGAYFGRWAWASDFIDFNLDGYPDIYVQNGFLTGPRAHDL